MNAGIKGFPAERCSEHHSAFLITIFCNLLQSILQVRDAHTSSRLHDKRECVIHQSKPLSSNAHMFIAGACGSELGSEQKQFPLLT